MKNVRLSKKVKKGRRRGGGSNPLLFFHTEEKLFNMKYICGKYLTITTVLKMHKFCHSGLKPFSNGKDVLKNQLYKIFTCLLIQEENLRNRGIVKSVENSLPKPLS